MRYDVPLIPQTSGYSCWAASIAMLLSWKNRATYDPLRIAENAGGPSYLPAFTGTGLMPSDVGILTRNGLVPVTFTPDVGGLKDLLVRHGPVMAAGWQSGYPHWRVVTGVVTVKDVYLGTVFLNDPYPVGEGRRYSDHARYFFERISGLARRETGEVAPAYFARLR